MGAHLNLPSRATL